VSFIRTGIREIGLKVRRQKTRMALRHQKRVLQKSEINLGREGVAQAVNFPEVRNEIVALKKLEQEQKEVASRIAQIEEGIKQVEAQREANAKEQNAALARLEEEKKPFVQCRNEAKASADLCERELGAVERRLQDNDAIDRDLMKQIATLQAQVPPPADLDAQISTLSARRARLPEERAELVRARLGSSEALRLAKEKLAKCEAELAAAEKDIATIRAEFEARDRTLNENSRAQQEAVREARAHHQTVEERKNPAYLNIGRHLATQRIAPPNAPHLLAEVHRHREAVDRHRQHRAELAHLSSQIDKQELRKFYFAVVSVLALLGVILPVIWKSPAKREWLPQDTDVILSINVDQLTRGEIAKRWRQEQPDVWQTVQNGLFGNAVKTPVLNLTKDTHRITRAISTNAAGVTRDFGLVEARGDVSQPIRAITQDPAFEKTTISGLQVWQKPDFAISRVGPRTLAVGSYPDVGELVRVRLGMRPDLKITGQLFDRFQALDQESAVRLISRGPGDLGRIFHPVFTPELLDSVQLLGFSLTAQNPARARLLLKTKTPQKAAELAATFRNDPQRLLRLQDSTLSLIAEPPQVDQRDTDIEARFNMPENVTRLVLQRLAKTDAPAPVVAGF
jgi:hypothetical protein